MGAACSRSSSSDGKDANIVDSNMQTTDRKERGEIEESMSVMGEDEGNPGLPNLVSDATLSDPLVKKSQSIQSEPDPSTGEIHPTSLEKTAYAKSDDAETLLSMKIRSAASLTSDETVIMDEDISVVAPDVNVQYSSDITTNSVDYSTDGEISVDDGTTTDEEAEAADGDGDDHDHPPIHDATIQIFLMAAYLGDSDPHSTAASIDSGGSKSPPGLGRQGSQSRSLSQRRMKRSASLGAKDASSKMSQRKGVYVKVSYKVNSSHGGKKSHKELSSQKYQSRGYDGDIVDFQEQLDMAIAMKDDKLDDESKVGDKSYLGDEIELRLKQQKKSAMSKAKLLGRCKFKLSALKMDGDWRELKLKLHSGDGSSSSSSSSSTSATSSSADGDAKEDSCGTLRVKVRFHWTSDKLTEFHDRMVQMNKRGSTRSLLLSSDGSYGSTSLSSNAVSSGVGGGGHRRTTSLATMKTSDLHRFFLSHSGDLNLRVIGVLFGNDTVEEWSVFETDDEWRKEIQSQGSPSDMMDSQMEDVEMLVEWKSPTESKDFQTEKHSSKLAEVLYFGDEISIPVKPFDDGGESARKQIVDHPQVVIEKDTDIHNAPGSLFFKMGKQTKYGVIQMGCALMRVADILERMSKAKDTTEESWLLIHQPLYEWMSPETFSMKLPNLFDASLTGAAATTTSEKPTAIGQVLIDCQCLWHD